VNATFRRRALAGWGATLVLASLVWILASSLASNAAAQTNANNGRELFTDARKGNCVACHPMDMDASAAGKARIGPGLTGMKGRFPDRAKLRAIIWDASDKTPHTVMPPYGKHRILTETEIDAVVRYLETL
jgi:sulfur-oxidizing protein SoxX